jgi:hypothetical protein
MSAFAGATQCGIAVRCFAAFAGRIPWRVRKEYDRRSADKADFQVRLRVAEGDAEDLL